MLFLLWVSLPHSQKCEYYEMDGQWFHFPIQQFSFLLKNREHKKQMLSFLPPPAPASPRYQNLKKIGVSVSGFLPLIKSPL